MVKNEEEAVQSNDDHKGTTLGILVGRAQIVNSVRSLVTARDLGNLLPIVCERS